MVLRKIILTLIFVSFFSRTSLAQLECSPCHTELGTCEIATGESGICVTGNCVALCADESGAMVGDHCFPIYPPKIDSPDAAKKTDAHCLNLECITLERKYSSKDACVQAVTNCCRETPVTPLCVAFLTGGSIVNTYCCEICSLN